MYSMIEQGKGSSKDMDIVTAGLYMIAIAWCMIAGTLWYCGRG